MCEEYRTPPVAVPDHLRHAYYRAYAYVRPEPGETSLCFLCHPTLTDEHVGRAVEVVREVVGRATRSVKRGPNWA